MVELSGRQITGVSKLTERHAAEFNTLVTSVEAYGDKDVRLDLTDLDIRGLWRRDAFFELAVRPNLTLILDPETADILKSFLIVVGKKANYEIREPDVIPEKEDPRIQERGEQYAKNAKIKASSLYFKVSDIGLDSLSSIGLSGQCVRRAIEIISKQAHKNSLKLVIDFTDILFEGGCDIVLADALVESRKLYKLVVRVLGDEGIAEYVRVRGNVKLRPELKVRYFKALVPGTVLRLNTYRSALRSDIAGRKGAGIVAGATLVIFRGVDGVDALYDEIPSTALYTTQDLIALGETPHTGDIYIPRRRNLGELGIERSCTGSYGHFGVVDKDEKYNVSDENGNLIEITEPDFVMRGLKNLGLSFNSELLKQGRIFPRKFI